MELRHLRYFVSVAEALNFCAVCSFSAALLNAKKAFPIMTDRSARGTPS